jgi:hypothetical protein
MADERVIRKCQTCGHLRYVGDVCQVCFLHMTYGKRIESFLRDREAHVCDSNTAVS